MTNAVIIALPVTNHSCSIPSKDTLKYVKKYLTKRTKMSWTILLYDNEWCPINLNYLEQWLYCESPLHWSQRVITPAHTPVLLMVVIDMFMKTCPKVTNRLAETGTPLCRKSSLLTYTSVWGVPCGYRPLSTMDNITTETTK